MQPTEHPSLLRSQIDWIDITYTPLWDIIFTATAKLTALPCTSSEVGEEALLHFFKSTWELWAFEYFDDAGQAV